LRKAMAGNKATIFVATVIAVFLLALSFGGAGTTMVTQAGSPYAIPLLPEEAKKIEEKVKVVTEVSEAVSKILESLGEEKPEEAKKAILQAPIETLLEGAPVTSATQSFDKDGNGVVDVVDLVEVLAEKGVVKKPPKVKKEFASTLLEVLKTIYGPNLENFPSPEGKLWLLAMYKISQ